MHASEWCSIVHVDFRPSFVDREAFIAALQAGIGPTFEEGEQVLRTFVADSASSATIEVAVLQQQHAPNHFDVVSRFASEAAYEQHLPSAVNLAYRRGIATALGSPYEDRLHSARGEQTWPSASIGDVVVITQIETQPEALSRALSLVDELVAAQDVDPALTGQVLLQRHYRPANLEVVSVWTTTESFNEHIASSTAAPIRAALEQLLVAPIDDRRHFLFAGEWITP